MDWLVLAGKYGFKKLSLSAERFLLRGPALSSFPQAQHINPQALARMFDARKPFIDALLRIKQSTDRFGSIGSGNLLTIYKEVCLA